MFEASDQTPNLATPIAADQDDRPEDRPVQKILLPGQTPEGEYILGILYKRTYDILPGKRCQRAESDRELIPGDQHYDGPMNSAVMFESDFVPFKVATDVVLNGSAHAPGGRPIRMMKTALIVGDYRKDLFIIGDRKCHYRWRQTPVFSDPDPFTSMEIRYERAYGGVDIYSDLQMQAVYPRNHLGRGYVVGNSKQVIEGLELPNIEDPMDPITPSRLSTGHFKDWETQPMPQGFGWVAKFSRPRAELAGVMPADRAVEQELRKAYREAVPEDQLEMYDQTELPDMDFRFFNGASPGLACPFLAGNETVQLLGLHPDGDITFELPGEHPHLGLDLGEGVQEPEVVLQTVMIRNEERQVDLVWRGAVPYPGPDWLPQAKKLEVSAQ